MASPMAPLPGLTISEGSWLRTLATPRARPIPASSSSSPRIIDTENYMASLDWPLTTSFMEATNIKLPRWLRSNKDTSLESFSMTKGGSAERTLRWRRTAPSWSTRLSLPRTRLPTFRSIRSAGHDIPFALRRRSASWELFWVPLLGWRRNSTRSSRTSSSTSTSYAKTTGQGLGRGEARRHADSGSRVMPIKPKNLRVGIITDASWGNAKQQRFLEEST